jgi:hypothetical protein
MNFLDAAFYLVQFGWKVFPLLPGSKIPAISKRDGGNGCLDATDDLEVISIWASRFPRANIGIACGLPSQIIVIDMDPRNGSEESVARLAAKKQIFSSTVTAKTGNGGTHLYYAYEPELKNSKSVLAPGIDVKTSGGYVVAAPSLLEAGKSYQWVTSPLGGSLPRLPRWAVEALKPRPRPVFEPKQADMPKDVAPLAGFVASSPKGERNNRLFWAGCRAAEDGVPGARDALLSAAQEAGLEKAEAEKTIDSALRRGKMK